MDTNIENSEPVRSNRLPWFLKSLLVLLVAFGAVSVCVYVLFFRSNAFMSTSRTNESLLEWRESSSGTQFKVTTSPTLVKTNSRLLVEAGGKLQDILIDDDATWGTIKFVRFEDWLLVLNDNYPMAGYNFRTSMLLGEGEWDKLPRNVSKGLVVASKKVGERSLPANYPR